MRKHHPDKRRGGYDKDSANANSKFIAIQEAWEMIGTEEKKKNFDNSILGCHKSITRSEEVSLSEFTKSMAVVFEESDATEKEMWVYEKTCLRRHV